MNENKVLEELKKIYGCTRRYTDDYVWAEYRCEMYKYSLPNLYCALRTSVINDRDITLKKNILSIFCHLRNDAELQQNLWNSNLQAKIKEFINMRTSISGCIGKRKTATGSNDLDLAILTIIVLKSPVSRSGLDVSDTIAKSISASLRKEIESVYAGQCLEAEDQEQLGGNFTVPPIFKNYYPRQKSFMDQFCGDVLNVVPIEMNTYDYIQVALDHTNGDKRKAAEYLLQASTSQMNSSLLMMRAAEELMNEIPVRSDVVR